MTDMRRGKTRSSLWRGVADCAVYSDDDEPTGGEEVEVEALDVLEVDATFAGRGGTGGGGRLGDAGE